MSSSPELDRLATLGWRPEDRGSRLDGVWRLGADPSVSYPTEGFAALGAHGGGSFWFDHRASEVSRQLERRTPERAIWEVGAGTGAMTARLERRGWDVVAIEPLAAGAAELARSCSAPVLCGLLQDLALPDGSLPAVGMFDVLEHLPDVPSVLAEVRRVLRSGGLLVVTVPAYSWLWSDEDEAAGHYLRFTRRRLSRVLADAGFEHVYSAYLYASLVLPAAVVRAVPYRLGRRRSQDSTLTSLASHLDPPRPVDATLRAVLRAESSVSRRVGLPFGTSILGIFRTP